MPPESFADHTERHGAEATNERMAEQALALEIAYQRLQDNALALESANEALRASAAALEQRTTEAERAWADAEAARRDAEMERTRAADILESMTDAHFVLDAEFRIVSVNAAMERGVGRTRSMLLGRSFWDVFPGTVGTSFERAYRRVAQERVSLHFTDDYGTDGLALVAEAEAYPAVGGGVAVFWRDVGPRLRAEGALRRSEARQAFLVALHDRLSPLTDPEQIQFEAATALGEHLGANRVGYAEIEEDGEHSIVTRNYTNGVQSLDGRYRVSDYSPGLLTELRAGRTVVRDDVPGDPWLTPAERAAHVAIGVAATVDIPLIKGERLVSVLFAHHREPHAWSSDELTLLADVASRTWDAVERARAEAALRSSEARLRVALDVAELGTWTWDLVTGAGDLDARGAEIVGLPPGSLANVAEAQLATIHPDDIAPTEAAIAAGLTGGGSFDLRYRVVRPDQRVYHVASRAHVVTDAEGRAIRLVGTNRDVTAEHETAVERERLLREAETGRDAAEAANRAKNYFLSTMSHELRTPLNAIAGYTQLLTLGLRGPLTELQQRDVERIERASRHLMGLVTDVLNFARLDAGQLEFQLADIEFADIVADLEPLISPQIVDKGLTFDHDACAPDTPESPHRVHADAERLRQILLNLLTNAVKFTDVGGRVSLACETDAAAGLVRVRIEDTGRGIPAHQLERIFEPFVQVDRHRTQESQQGVGLGLAISRDLARRMGGDLTAESEEGRGSTFTLTLRRATASA